MAAPALVMPVQPAPIRTAQSRFSFYACIGLQRGAAQGLQGMGTTLHVLTFVCLHVVHNRKCMCSPSHPSPSSDTHRRTELARGLVWLARCVLAVVLTGTPCVPAQMAAIESESRRAQEMRPCRLRDSAWDRANTLVVQARSVCMLCCTCL